MPPLYGPSAMPPSVMPPATPPSPGGFPGGAPPAGPPHWTGPPNRIGGFGQMPDWLQQRIDAFNSMHNQAVANRGGIQPGGVNVPGAGAGYSAGPTTSGWWGQTHTGPPLPPNTGPPGPPVQPPNWQDYWAQWYRQRQPYADWLSSYYRGA